MTTLTAPSLRLDPEHRYWLGDRELISVTTALTEAGLIDTAWFTDAAAERGTYVHQACELVDERDLGRVEPACAGYVDAYRRFLVDAKPEWQHTEHQVCDPVAGYAGTLDRLGVMNFAWTILDIKTGPPAPWHGLQLAGYARLVPRMGVRPLRFDLYLTADGAYRLEPQRTRTDEANFLAALAVAQFRRQHGPR